MISRHFATLLLFLSTGALSDAQQVAIPTVNVTVRLVALNIADAIPEVYIQDPAEDDNGVLTKSAIKTYLNHESSALKLKGKKVVFTTKPDRGSMKRQGELLGELIVDDKIKSAILVFLPGGKNDLAKFIVLQIEDTKQKFPAGCYRILNLSKPVLRFILSGKNYDFKGGFEDFLIEKPPIGPDKQVPVQFYAQKGKEMVLMASYIWPNPGENRSLIFAYQNGQDVVLKPIDDNGPKAEKLPAPKVR
jgi:hypothetical protein